MKKNLLKILALSLFITIIGSLMDSDPKEPIMAMRFLEFFAMLGIIFIFFSIIYYASTFLLRKIKILASK